MNANNKILNHRVHRAHREQLLKTRIKSAFVMPVKTGIQILKDRLDSRFRENDLISTFYFVSVLSVSSVSSVFSVFSVFSVVKDLKV
jgi:hypothetical protein